jgi:hypothetical protein
MSSIFGNFGFQPNSFNAFTAEATSLGGSPFRRGFSIALIGLPETLSHV